MIEKYIAYFLGGILFAGIIYVHSDIVGNSEKGTLRIYSFREFKKISISKKKNHSLPVIKKEGSLNEAFKKKSLNEKIPIEKASMENLVAVKGIGEKTAKKILEKISSCKGKVSEDDLLSIKGIGKHKLELLKKHFIIKHSTKEGNISKGKKEKLHIKSSLLNPPYDRGRRRSKRESSYFK